MSEIPLESGHLELFQIIRLHFAVSIIWGKTNVYGCKCPKIIIYVSYLRFITMERLL